MYASVQCLAVDVLCSSFETLYSAKERSNLLFEAMGVLVRNGAKVCVYVCRGYMYVVVYVCSSVCM